MQLDQIEVLDRVYATSDLEELYSVWREFTELLGYSKSAIMVFDWSSGRVAITPIASYSKEPLSSKQSQALRAEVSWNLLRQTKQMMVGNEIDEWKLLFLRSECR